MTREEAIKSLRGILTEAVEFENSVCYVTDEDREPLEMAIKALEQEPKSGHWIRKNNTKEPLYGWYFCSECNSVIGDKTKFCSNCGARMESEE